MPKGVPWTKPETDRLLKLRQEGKTASEIASAMGKSSEAVAKKLNRLGLKVVQAGKTCMTTTTSAELVIPKELFTVEEALKIQAAALKALETPGLSKSEILRLKSVATTARAYQENFAKYMDYRGLERDLVRLRQQFEESEELRKRRESKN